MIIIAGSPSLLKLAGIAALFWASATGERFEFADGCAGPGCVTVDTYPRGQYWKAGYTDCYRGRCQIRIREDWALRPEIFVHELGHAIGLRHVKDRNDVMYEATGGACVTRETLLQLGERYHATRAVCL